jgi:DUF2993 family protein
MAVATRGGRALRSFVIVIVVLVVLLVAADRIGVYVAERAAGDTMQSSQHLNSRPDVDVTGFPFLTQLAAGEFDEIIVTAHDVPVGQSAHLLDVSQVRVDFRHVHVARDFSSVRAETASASAFVSYADLGKTLGIAVSYAGSGRIRATKKITAAGQTLTATITTSPQLRNGALGFASTAVNGLGQLGNEVGSALNGVFGLTLPLQGIPFKVRVTSLTAAADGVHLGLAGANLSYSK